MDSIGYEYGVGSEQFDADVNAFFNVLDEAFFKKLKGKLNNTPFMLSADHGMAHCDVQNPIYLNLKYPDLISKMKTI